MGRVGTVVWKEFRQIRREPRLMVFMVVAPLLLLFLFGVALRLQFENVPLALVDEDKTYLSLMVKDRLWEEDYFVLDEVDSVEEIRARLDAGRARVGVRIPPDFTEKLVFGETARVELFTDGTMPTVAIAMESNAGAALGTDFESTLVFGDPDEPPPPAPVDRLELDVHTLYNSELRDEAFFLPGVIGILVMQVGLVLASSAIVREKEYRTIEQLLVVPLERHQIILGKLAPYALVAFADFLLTLGAGLTVFELPFAGSPVLLVALTAVYIVTILSLGLLISTVAETQQQAIFGSIFVLIPSILLSGFVFPVEAMPGYVRPLSDLLPLTHYLVLIRGIMLKGVGLALLWPAVAWLVGISAVTLTLATLRLRTELGE